MNLCSIENSRTIPIGRCEFEQIQYINLFHATALFLYPLKTSENQGFSDVYRRYRTSVIRQKGESQNGCFKKAKHGKFSEKRTFLTPWYAYVRFEIRPFALLPMKIDLKACVRYFLSNFYFSANDSPS